MHSKNSKICADCGTPLRSPRSVRCKSCNVRNRGRIANEGRTGPNPSGLCMCGCGQKTALAKATKSKTSIVRGKPQKYVAGHYTCPIGDHPSDANPSGLCLCGCGEPTVIIRKTYRGKFLFKGHHTRYLTGHDHRRSVLYEIDVESGCWLWIGAKNQDGYGITGRGKRAGRSSHAHRWMWEETRGRVPDGMELDHLCGVRHCVNPDHLEPVTHQENVRRAKPGRR